MSQRRRPDPVTLCLLLLRALVGLAPIAGPAQTPPPALQRARELNHQALEEFRKGEYAAAIPKAREALVLREKGLPPTHLLVGESLQTLADLLRETGEYAEARPLYERALAIREKTLGAQNPAVGWNLNELGAPLVRTGGYPAAPPLAE